MIDMNHYSNNDFVHLNMDHIFDDNDLSQSHLMNSNLGKEFIEERHTMTLKEEDRRC